VGQVEVTIDGSARDIEAGQPIADLLDGDPDVIAATVDGIQRDLSHSLSGGETVEGITISSDAGRAILRHSTAHVLAQAVQELFPGARLGIGPPIKDGFYYDFEVPEPFTPEDLAVIEKRMKGIIKESQRFSRRVVSESEAAVELAEEPFKLELIRLKASPGLAEGASVEVGGGELTIYDNVRRDGSTAWGDLCRGPHLPTTRRIPAFKLMRVAAAYWRGDENNPQLQRIYGTAWESKDALKAHVEFLAEAERRDHRRLGAELDLFSFPDRVGSGLAVWHPKGGVIRRVMEDYSRKRHEEADYQFVYTPHVTKEQLFVDSGHLQWYADGMYPPMELDQGQRYYLKPMNCPMHMLIYSSRGRSYRELPMRLFEFGTVYRYEKSGVVHGLTRARGFTQDDSHIFCTPEQLAAELGSLLEFVVGLLRDYGLTDFTAELSTRPDHFVGEPAQWEEAEAALEAALQQSGLDYTIAEGEGAFYAPKIDVHVADAIGRRWQLSTLQVDLQLPVRFDLQYQASDGSRQRPYVIHRALFGSEERFFGILLEHYAGAFPPWLAPVQVVSIPITDQHVPYLREVADRLRSQGVRVEVDAGEDRMQKKIRNAQRAKVPFMLLAGDADVAAGAVSFRYRDGTQNNGVPIDDAVAEIVEAVQSRRG
jgi:threonyl-tRNA synthetase